jgi:hypothetical protein
MQKVIQEIINHIVLNNISYYYYLTCIKHDAIVLRFNSYTFDFKVEDIK